MNSIMLDNHEWFLQDNGLYVPDEPYVVKLGGAWGVGDEYLGKSFILKRNADTSYCVLAASFDWDSIKELWDMEDRERSNGSEIVVYTGSIGDNIVGGLEYVIPES